MYFNFTVSIEDDDSVSLYVSGVKHRRANPLIAQMESSDWPDTMTLFVLSRYTLYTRRGSSHRSSSKHDAVYRLL